MIWVLLPALGILILLGLVACEAAYDAGKYHGYRQGCDDCRRGVIPQHHGLSVYGSTGSVKRLPDIERHAGLRLVEDDED